MKLYVFAVTCLLALSSSFASDSCYNDVSLDCSQASNSLVLPKCNAIYGNYGHLAKEMQAYANLNLKRSYEYLLFSSYYNNYQTNRVGFSKLFRKLSDHAWEKTIDLIKHITVRGGVMDFASNTTQETDPTTVLTVELHELESMAKALDIEKELAERAFYIHREATRNTHHLHDAEIAQYMEEEFVEHQAKTVRELAGHTNDLKKFVSGNAKGQDLSLSLYLFDEYLQKVV